MSRPEARGGLYLVAAALGLLLTLSLAVTVTVWRALADIELGLHGILALLLGVAATLGLGIGLMRLVYHSHRHGYDDRAGYD